MSKRSTSTNASSNTYAAWLSMNQGNGVIGYQPLNYGTITLILRPMQLILRLLATSAHLDDIEELSHGLPKTLLPQSHFT
jgi:hypothetical protein